MTRDRGSAAVFILVAMAVVAVVGIGTASVGGLIVSRERAMTAAEAAALVAAVASYPPAANAAPSVVAAEYATRNGAILERCSCPTNATLNKRTVTVITRVDVGVPLFGEVAVRGAASAEFDPRAWLGP